MTFIVYDVQVDGVTPVSLRQPARQSVHKPVKSVRFEEEAEEHVSESDREEEEGSGGEEEVMVGTDGKFQLLTPSLLPETVGNMMVLMPHKMWRPDMVAKLVQHVVERNHVDAVIVNSPRNHIHGYMGCMPVHRTDCSPAEIEDLISAIHKEDGLHRFCVVWDSFSAKHAKELPQSKCISSPETLNLVNIVALAAADDLALALRTSLVNQSQVMVVGYNMNSKKMWNNYELCPWTDEVDKKKDLVGWMDVEVSHLPIPDDREMAFVVFPDASRVQRQLCQHMAYIVAPSYAVQLPKKVAQKHGYRVRGKPKCVPTEREKEVYSGVDDDEWVRVWGDTPAVPFPSSDLVARMLNSMRLSVGGQV